MTKTAKIAISLPEEVLDTLERERMARGESRNEFIRRAMEVFLRNERDREAVEQYIRGYQQHPKTEDEIAMAQSTLRAALAANPWEDSTGQCGVARCGGPIFLPLRDIGL